MPKQSLFGHYFSKIKNKMSDFYQNLVNHYQNKAIPQKTPQQIADEQKISAYQTFITTPAGVEALNEVNVKFGIWFDENYGTKPAAPSKEVSELKEMMANMAKQIESLTNQLK